MFRYVTELKGLVIDIDSFHGDLNAWKPIIENYYVCFITSSDDTNAHLLKRISPNCVYKATGRTLWPNEETHSTVLHKLKLQTTEIAYVSADQSFLINALSFCSGTILICCDKFTYQKASMLPDVICDSVNSLVDYLHTGQYGYYGERAVDPCHSFVGGFLIHTSFLMQNQSIPLISLGRYFGSDHYMYQLHPYSSSIFLNKQTGRKSYGVFNELFANLLSDTVQVLKKDFSIDSICYVPTKPESPDRFKEIVDQIASENQLENISEHFICVKDYTSQKSLSRSERRKNVKGAFVFEGDLTDKHIVIIDDVITTGATITECCSVLKKHHCSSIVIITLAINQLARNYWCQYMPNVKCPKCNDIMYLKVNSRNRSFFYNCLCGYTESYRSAFDRLASQINNEFTDKEQED